MCGIAGFLTLIKTDNPFAIATRMADAIVHRGPDDAGAWVDEAAGVALAHRRLSVLDLSPAGHQPMVSASGRYVIAFNGEIYNHLDLRRQLGDRAWRGHSDTETLLAGFEIWGIEQTLQRAVGMFAIALWGRDTRTLALALRGLIDNVALRAEMGRRARKIVLGEFSRERVVAETLAVYQELT